MSSSANGAVDARQWSCPLVYSHIFVPVFSMLYVLSFTASRSYKHIYVVTNLFVYFWIKLCLNLPNYLTIQKLDNRHFLVSCFVAALKPAPFYGTHYKR